MDEVNNVVRFVISANSPSGMTSTSTAYAPAFSSALISFDKDVDVKGRKAQPQFYGYIPDDHATRGSCFFLMTMISAFHNTSRSFGCALLVVSGENTLVVYFVVGEMLLYLMFKVARGDFMYWIRTEGPLGLVLSFLARVFAKIIADFSGCLHVRHP